jgi:hexosaminidase
MLPVLTLILVACCSSSFAQADRPISLMPLPGHLTAGSGELTIGGKFRLELEADAKDPLAISAAHRALAALDKRTGRTLRLDRVKAGSSRAPQSLLVVVHAAAEMKMGVDESYSLTVTRDGARLEAATSVGALRGLATFRQLIQQDGKRVFVPAVTIEDAPLYAWRGLMIDVARHFIPVEVVKRNLDAMEMVKMNVLHLHLSDNEGFRIESKVLPKLQEDGSDGKYFTQAEIRDLVSYAGERGIMVVPEFDMPGHSKSWFAGYPELSSSPGPFKPGITTYEGLTPTSTREEIQAAMDTAKVPAFDPTLETTYKFLNQFVGEMAGLFPSPYFHIGGDENNGAVWLANPAIAAYMHDHHFADPHALQAYFIARVEDIVEKHGKQMVAWEEAFTPGRSTNAVFEAWIPDAKPDLLTATMDSGNKVLLARGFYLDIFLPAGVHYLNDAVPADAATNKNLLGGEAAMWTEMADGTNIEARIWPRAGAVAERLWSAPGTLDVADMYRRLFVLSAELDREGVKNLADYDAQVRRLAGASPADPVKTLLDVLAPIKGYKRLMAAGMKRALGADPNAPFHSVADAVLVDSAAKYEFRDAVASWLKTHDAASEQTLRTWLVLWSRNDALLEPYFAQSSELREVAGHSKQLAALADAALQALEQLHKGEALSASQLAADDALLKAAQAVEGETEIAVLPEIEALLHGTLPPEPSEYAIF